MKWLVIPLCLIWLSNAVAFGADAVYEVKAWRALSDRSVSPLARSVLRDGRLTWTHAESPHFLVHASRASLLPPVVVEAEWTYAEIGRRLNWAIPESRGRILVFDRHEQWSRVMNASGRREEGMALQVRNEIFILRGEGRSGAYVDVAHELVHYLLWQAYGRTVPLWLEEGLAMYLGWEVAKAFYLEVRGLRLYREQPVLDPAAWIPWPELFALNAYPEAPEAMPPFYRQTGRLVEELAARLGADEWGTLLRAFIASQRTLEDWLQEDQGWPTAEVQAMLNRIEDELLGRKDGNR